MLDKFASKFLLVFFSLCVLFFLFSCGGGISVEDRINGRLVVDGGVDSELLSFSVSGYDAVKKHIVLNIECNFDKVGSGLYLKELTRVESLILSEGVNSISYRIVNKGEGLSGGGVDLGVAGSLGRGDKLLSEGDRVLEGDGGVMGGVMKGGGGEGGEGAMVGALDDTVEIAESIDSVGRSSSSGVSVKGGSVRSSVRSSVRDVVISKRELWKSAIVSANFVNLRDKASVVNSDVITYLFTGVVVRVLERGKYREKIGLFRDFWYRVETRDKKSGWVFGKYLRSTSVRRVSSYLENNIIYNDFLVRREFLLSEDIRKLMESGGYEVDISYRLFVLSIRSGTDVFLPFHIEGDRVHWDLSKMTVRGDMPYLKGVKAYGKNSSIIEVELEKGGYGGTLEDSLGLGAGGSGKGFSGSMGGEGGEGGEGVFSGSGDLRGKEFEDGGEAGDGGEGEDGGDGGDGLLEGDLINRGTDSGTGSGIARGSSSVSVVSMSDYNIELVLSDNLKGKLIFSEYRRASAVMKLVEAKLLSRDYDRDISFHYRFNRFYDTISISLYDIDFVRKLALFRVIRRGVDLGGGVGGIVLAEDSWDIDFAVLGFRDRDFNYGRLGELYYSDIMHAMTGLLNKGELIGLANLVVSRLLVQSYV